MVRLLVSHGADVEKRDRVRRPSPLCLSSPSVPPAHLCALFSCQIHESSPLDLASEESERLPCLLTLLDMGARVNAEDKHSTCVCRDPSGVPALTPFRSFPNPTSEGKTPLLHALASSDGLTVHNTENIRLLLQRGADWEHATSASSG